jgi:hypothetical protein
MKRTRYAFRPPIFNLDEVMSACSASRYFFWRALVALRAVTRKPGQPECQVHMVGNPDTIQRQGNQLCGADGHFMTIIQPEIQEARTVNFYKSVKRGAGNEV